MPVLKGATQEAVLSTSHIPLCCLCKPLMPSCHLAESWVSPNRSFGKWPSVQFSALAFPRSKNVCFSSNLIYVLFILLAWRFSWFFTLHVYFINPIVMALRERLRQSLYIFSKVKGVSDAHLAQGFQNGSLQSHFPPQTTGSIFPPPLQPLLQRPGSARFPPLATAWGHCTAHMRLSKGLEPACPSCGAATDEKINVSWPQIVVCGAAGHSGRACIF